jgi:antitoxin (DNA-binding transcriptional repressor) of toxin-antitoxin stability system
MVVKEMAISKFKATCLSVLEDVRKTGTPILVTRFGKPMAEIVAPPKPKLNSWLGCMKDSAEISGDIVEPVGALDGWAVDEK